MADFSDNQRRNLAKPPNRRWLLALLGLLAVAGSHPLLWRAGQSDTLFAPLGIGLALTAWLGYGIVPAVVVVLAVIQTLCRPEDSTIWQAVADALLTGLEIGWAWWCYRKAGGSRNLEDPLSSTMFLLIVPGIFGGIFNMLQYLNGFGVAESQSFNQAAAVSLGVGHILGIVALAPPLLAVATPWLVHYGLALSDPSEPRFVIHPRFTWTTGEVLETIGLTIGASILGAVLAVLHVSSPNTHWHWWGMLLLVIVWASLRLGLRGGSIVAAVATLLTLYVTTLRTDSTDVLNPLRANLLAQTCTALLIGASADWIRASEARYRQVVGQIAAVLYSGRFLRPPAPGSLPEVEILFVSAGAKEIMKAEPRSLLGDFHAWLERIYPADRELMQAALAQLMLQKRPVVCEYRLADEETEPLPADETNASKPASSATLNLARSLAQPQRYVRNTLTPHYGADGRLDGWDGVVEDITEQQQLAQGLRRTTNMLQALIAHLPTGIYFVHGANGRPLLVNARARQLLGQRDDLVPDLSHLSEVYNLHRTDGQPFPWQELPVTKALHDGASSMRDDIVVHRPDGRRVPLVTWAAAVDLAGQGHPDAAVWVLEDLTALRQSEEQYRRLVESLPLMLFQFDQHSSLISHNPAAEEITGYSNEALRQQGFWQERIHAEDAPAFAALLDAAGAGQSPRAEVRYRAADGSEKVGYALAQPRRPGGATVLVVDMTQKRRLEQELQKVQRLDLVGRIASGVVHDFNNLLTVVIGYTDMARKAIGNHAATGDLQHVLEAADQAKQLAGQLLTFSRQRQVVTRPIDLRAATKRALDLLLATQPDNIEVETRGGSDPVMVLADDAPLQQIIMNLCLNARDAMPHGGRLSVETACEELPAEAVLAGTENGTSSQSNTVRKWGRLTVSDTGCGIDESIKARIFEPLFTTKDRGSGLGLAVVKQIAEGFGGAVRVSSEPGKGTRFDVWLPLEGGKAE